MKVRAFGNLVQITFLANIFPINCYFVRENDGLTLIDTGISSSAKGIIETAKALHLPVVRIVLTHSHGDHAGSLHALHKAYPDAEVFVSSREARILQGDRSLDPYEPQVPLRGGYITYKAQPIRMLMPGDRVGSLEVVACPGHTPGHIAYLDTRDKTLIAGDAFQTRGGIAVAGVVRPLFPFPAFGTWHKPTALASAKQLLALQPRRLAVGHGDVLDDPMAAMERAIQVAERKIRN